MKTEEKFFEMFNPNNEKISKIEFSKNTKKEERLNTTMGRLETLTYAEAYALETLQQKIADWCNSQKLPKWYTIDELLELHHSSNNSLTLTYTQKEKLYHFKKQLEKYY